MPGLAGSFSYAHTTSSTRSQKPRVWRYAVTSAHVRQSEPSASFFLTIVTCMDRWSRRSWRSEEHTSELQSRLHLVCRLLLEKKKKQKNTKKQQNRREIVVK